MTLRSLLKIWNVNKCTGVVGVFNCQGAGWCRITKKTSRASPAYVDSHVVCLTPLGLFRTYMDRIK